MADFEEKGYEVIDKRSYLQDEGGEAKAKAEEEAAEPSPKENFNFPPVDVYSLLKSFIGMLGMHSWQWMGLVKNPSTGELERDMVQAKVAIDSLSALAAQLEGKLNSSEEKELRELISNLQLNYVQQNLKA